MSTARATFIAGVLLASAVAQQSEPSFDVASIRLNKTNTPAKSLFPLGPGDVYTPTGGRFQAAGFPLITYIAFAYKIIGNQAQSLLPQFPDWAKTDRYDIEAKAEGNPSKDQMRTLMRTLLADRFGLRLHTENREVPVLAFVLDKPGKPGPQLWPHTQAGDCPTEATPNTQGTVATDARGVPILCNGIFALPTSTGKSKLGARNITLQFLADSLSAGANLGRPMIDLTGQTGRFDVVLEFVPERLGQPAGDSPETSGPNLQQALQEQLGIKLQSAKNSMDVLVLDQVQRPSEN